MNKVKQPPISYPEMEVLMKKYNLTWKDMPPFPPRDTDFRKLIIAIGEAKKINDELFDSIKNRDKWYKVGWEDCKEHSKEYMTKILYMIKHNKTNLEIEKYIKDILNEDDFLDK